MKNDLIDPWKIEEILIGGKLFSIVLDKKGNYFFFQKDFHGIFHPGSVVHTKDKLPRGLLADMLYKDGKTTRRAKLISLEAVLFMAAKMRAYDFYAELSSLISPVRFKDFENLVALSGESISALRKKEKHEAFVKELVELCDEIHCSSYPCPHS